MTTTNIPTFEAKPDFEQFYYIREKNLYGEGKYPISCPFACVCLRGYKQNGNWYFARGVSICSPKDKFVKAVGRKKAAGVLNTSSNKYVKVLGEDLYENLQRVKQNADGLDITFGVDNSLYFFKAEFALKKEHLTNFEKNLVSQLF